MSGHNIVSQLTESAAAVSGLDLVAPLLLVGNGDPVESGTGRHDAYLYIKLDAADKNSVLWVNNAPGHATTSAWDAISAV